MNINVTTALIAAVVSLLVSLITIWINRTKIASEEKRQRLEHRRKLTEILLIRRMEAYPKAFEITYLLTSPFILKDPNVKLEHLEKVKEQLIDWEKKEGAFLFTKSSLKAYRELIRSLSISPREDGTFSRDDRDNLWRWKNRFRGALKSDLSLFYEEDEKVRLTRRSNARN
ncbi:hypothetical protein J7M07_05895 [bacterium]|nr:hypothetical protein [bacterium]